MLINTQKSLASTVNLSNNCIVKNCPALKSPVSGLGYCPIHHKVCCDPQLFQQALDGRISAIMKEFAKEVERGVYPRVK